MTWRDEFPTIANFEQVGPDEYVRYLVDLVKIYRKHYGFEYPLSPQELESVFASLPKEVRRRWRRTHHRLPTYDELEILLK